MRKLLLVFVLTGCKVPVRDLAPEPQRDLTKVAAPFDVTWNAVVDEFARRNIPVQTIEKASGFIVAEIAVIPSRGKPDYEAALALADCGAEYYSNDRTWHAYAPTNAKYNIVVRPIEGGSSVRVTTKYISADRTAVRNCNSKRKFESDTEAAVKRAAEAKP